MALRKMGKTYYVYFRDLDGRIVTRSLKTTDKTLAQSLHRSFMLELQAKRGRLVIVQNFPEQFKDTEKITTLAPPVEIVAGDHQRGSIALDAMFNCACQKRTWEDKERRAQMWKRFVSAMPCKYADEVTPQMALKYLESEFGAASGKTYNNHKTALNTIYRLCLVEAGLSQSPFAPIANRKLENVEHHRALSAAEFKQIFQAASEPWKTAALISWYTALRRETCFRLAWEHINPEDTPPSITIMPGKTARFGRAVYIPIHRRLWEHLCTLPRPDKDSTPILSQWKAKAHYPGYKNYEYFTGLLKSLNITDSAEGKASFHSLRSSFITRCDEAGVHRRATRGVAGQTTDQITDLYSHDKETAKQILSLPDILAEKDGEV